MASPVNNNAQVVTQSENTDDHVDLDANDEEFVETDFGNDRQKTHDGVCTLVQADEGNYPESNDESDQEKEYVQSPPEKSAVERRRESIESEKDSKIRFRGRTRITRDNYEDFREDPDFNDFIDDMVERRIKLCEQSLDGQMPGTSGTRAKSRD